MERLLSSSSPTPLKLHLKPSPFLHRLGRIDSGKLNLPASQLPNLRRVSLVSCKRQNPSPLSSSSPSPSAPSNILPSLSSNQCESPNGSEPKYQLLNQIATGAGLLSSARPSPLGHLLCFLLLF